MKKFSLMIVMVLLIVTGCNSLSNEMMQSPEMKNIARDVMADAMKNPEVQRQMFKAIAESPEARKAMVDIMKTPEMRDAFIDIIKSPEMKNTLWDMFNEWIRSRLNYSR